jgi:hypothetical protein
VNLFVSEQRFSHMDKRAAAATNSAAHVLQLRLNNGWVGWQRKCTEDSGFARNKI